MFEQKLCSWNTNSVQSKMAIFDESKCTENTCFDCIYEVYDLPSAIPSSGYATNSVPSSIPNADPSSYEL